MTVTDPDVPDPLHDPRTTQADPGAPGQGADLASAGDDAVSAGEDELADDPAGAPGEDPVADDPAGAPDEQLTEQTP